MIRKLAFAALSLFASGVALAQSTAPTDRLPLDEGGLLALALGCVAVAAGIVRSKRK